MSATPVLVVTSGPATPVRESDDPSATPVLPVESGQATPVIFTSAAGATPVRDVSPFTPAAQDFFDAVAGAGGTISGPRKIIYNNFFIAIDGLPLSRVGIFGPAENTITANIDLVYPAKSVLPVLAPTWTANQGYLSAGAGSYLNIQEAFSEMTELSLNSTMFGAVCFADRAATNAIFMGTPENGNDQSELLQKFGDGDCYCAINSEADGNNAPANIRGIWVVNRVASNQFTIRLNDTLVVTAGEPSTAVPTGDMFLLIGRNGAGNPILPSPDTMCAYYIGGGLTAPQITQLTTALNDLFVAVGMASFL